MSDPAGRPASYGREQGVAKSEEDRKKATVPGTTHQAPFDFSSLHSSLFTTPYFLGRPGGASELKISLFFSM